MIAHLRGTVRKGQPGEVSIDVGGVGYRVAVPLPVWDALSEATTAMLWVTTYVREERFDLFGFLEQRDRSLFETLIELQGIGPRLALELMNAPRSLLAQCVTEEDPKLLTNIKGVGRKTAEKLLVELKSLAERKPELLSPAGGGGARLPAQFDADAVAALAQLGYTTSDILRALEGLPKQLKTTEERVTAALRSL